MNKILPLSFLLTIFLSGCSKDEIIPLPEHVTIQTLDYDIDNSSVLILGTEPQSGLNGTWSIENNVNDGTFLDTISPLTTFKGSLIQDYVLRWTISNGTNEIYAEQSINIAMHFTLKQLINAEVDIKILLEKFSIQELLISGLTVRNLLDAGITIQQLILAGVIIEHILDGGATIHDLLSAEVSIQELINGGVTVKELLEANIKIEQLLKADVSIQRIYNAGATIQELLGADVLIQELLDSGITVNELLISGIAIHQLLDADVSVKDILDAGATIHKLFSAGVSIQELIEGGATVNELIDSSITIQNLLTANVPILEIINAGVSSLELIQNNVSKEKLINAKVIVQIPSTRLYLLNYFYEKFGHVQAVDFCNNLTIGDLANWRLPNIEELRIIYNARNTALLEYTNENYWSATFAGFANVDGVSTSTYLVKHMGHGKEENYYGFQKRIIPIIQL
ncbi:MAG: DUF1566 domain-containing protein [Cyclobacteriaceae bacterium]